MIAKSVLACHRSVGLVTEDASPRANKSTDHDQLPDIWKLGDGRVPAPRRRQLSRRVATDPRAMRSDISVVTAADTFA
jgi:hypothetical protein